MFDAVSVSTVSGPVCVPAPGGPSSSDAASRVAIAYQPDLETNLRPRYRSLRRETDFSAAYRKGKRRRCGAITVVVAPGPTGPATVGFVAGKKVGSAVQRNRAKRRLREAAAQSDLKDDTVYVLIADSGVSDAPFPRLIEAINRCIRELSLPGDVR